MYIYYKKRFKKPIQNIAKLMPQEFSDTYFVETFKRLYHDLWEDLNKQYKYWHDKNAVLIKYGKKSRYNFRKPYNFILDCSYHCRIRLRKDTERDILSKDEIAEDNFEFCIINICLFCPKLLSWIIAKYSLTKLLD